MTAQWKNDNNYGYTLVIGQNEQAIFARAYPSGSGRQATLAAIVRTPVFPVMEKSGFSSMQEARQWAESWVNFADELLNLRIAVEGMREQRLCDFQEIMELRGKLHEYEYPKVTSESERLP